MRRKIFHYNPDKCSYLNHRVKVQKRKGWLKMKKISKLLFVVVFGMVLTGCGTGNTTQSTEVVVSDGPETESTAVEVELEEIDAEDASEEGTTETPVELKRVGEEGYGFVDIPVDWVNFQDINSTQDLRQYSDLTGTSIITLFVVGDSPNDAEQAATNSWAGMENNGAVDIQGAIVELDGYETYQVYGIYENAGIMLVTYHFEDEEGKLHYISAESNQGGIIQVIELVEDTYSVTE